MKVYFFVCPLGPVHTSGFDHNAVAIAEGLKELGVPFSGNINYWRMNDSQEEYLIRHHPDESFMDADVVIVSCAFYFYDRLSLLPPSVFAQAKNYKLVFLDYADSHVSPGLRSEMAACTLVLRSNFNIRSKYPPNFVPWQFGLTNRLIESAKPIPFGQRKKQVLVNFRIPHTVRGVAEQRVLRRIYSDFPKNDQVDSFDEASVPSSDKLLWEQTGCRHYSRYYERLGQSQLCAAFGGYMSRDMSESRYWIMRRLSKLFDMVDVMAFSRIYQFDSWRFWESLIAGCVTLHVDLRKYGARMPIDPISNVHYLGVDFSDVGKALATLKNEAQLQQIAEAGREWAILNYSPRATAQRLLSYLRT